MSAFRNSRDRKKNTCQPPAPRGTPSMRCYLQKESRQKVVRGRYKYRIPEMASLALANTQTRDLTMLFTASHTMCFVCDFNYGWTRLYTNDLHGHISPEMHTTQTCSRYIYDHTATLILYGSYSEFHTIACRSNLDSIFSLTVTGLMFLRGQEHLSAALLICSRGGELS